MDISYQDYVASENSYRRASVLGRRIPEVENVIKIVPAFAFRYAKNVIKGRWPEGEDSMRQGGISASGSSIWMEYLNFLTSHYTNRRTWNKQVWRWLKDPKYKIEHTLDILNYSDYDSNWGSNREMQEYIIQQRPDLINKIYDLSSALERKYAHERELSNLDV